MTKLQFEKELRNKLAHVSVAEKQKIVDYFNELFWEKSDAGEDEKSIIKSFGDIDEIVASFTEDSFFEKNVKAIKSKTRSFFSNKYLLTVYFSLFFITIPLTIAALSIVFSLGIAVLAVIFSFFVCGVVFVIAGPLYAGYGVYLLFSHPASGLAQIGVGVCVFGMGVLFFLLLRYVEFLRILVFVKKGNKKKAYARANGMKKLRAVLAITSVVIIVLGAGVFTAGFAKADWSYARLDTVEYTAVREDIDAPVTEINVNVKSRNVYIVACSDDFKVQGFNYLKSELAVDFDRDAGVLTIKESYRYSGRDIFEVFALSDHKKQRVYIYLPKNISQIKVTSIAGDLRLEGFNADAVSVQSTAGDLRMKDCEIGELNVRAAAGDVRITNSKINNVNVRTTAGDVKIWLIGKRNEYSIELDTRAGNKNMKDQINTSSDKKIYISTTAGDIKLYFK